MKTEKHDCGARWEVLPCPFCNKKPNMLRREGEMFIHNPVYIIRCDNEGCGSIVQTVSGCPEECVRKWNGKPRSEKFKMLRFR